LKKYQEFFLACVVVFAIAFVGTALMWEDAKAQSQYGTGRMTVFLGTASSGTETLTVGTGHAQAKSDSVLAYVTIGSAVSGNALFKVYDSSTTSTTSRRLVGTFSCGTPNSFPLFQSMQYGLLMVNTGCEAGLSYATHK